jgi:hypothetical protein
LQNRGSGGFGGFKHNFVKSRPIDLETGWTSRVSHFGAVLPFNQSSRTSQKAFPFNLIP